MNKKYKIAFIMPYIGCGGVETTFLSLLKELNTEIYDITLLLLERKGAFIERLPEDIHIKYISVPEKEWGIFYGKKNMLKQYLKQGKFHKIPSFLRYNNSFALSEDRTENAEYFKRISSSIPQCDETYDLAVDYFGYATFTTFYLAEKVHAKVKVSWLHSIMSRFYPQSFEPWYAKMDVIFACSKMVKQDFENVFPSVKTVQCFYNIINANEIREKASQSGGFIDDYNGIRILTVGRICNEKGIDLAAQAFVKLWHEGYRIRWYVVGGGGDESIVEAKKYLENDDQRENFVFLGIQANPYPFMKQCDIYVQPSRFEGYCTTTNEARILGCPIVMTDVSGAREQIIDGENGFIVSIETEEIYQAVKKLIDDADLRKQFSDNLVKLDCDTRKEIKKLEDLLDKS